MTVDFDRTAHCQCNHQCLTEFQQILTEQQWLCFDRTTCLTENLDEFAFDRNTNRKNVLSKNTLSCARRHISNVGQGWFTPPNTLFYGKYVNNFNLVQSEIKEYVRSTIQMLLQNRQKNFISVHTRTFYHLLHMLHDREMGTGTPPPKKKKLVDVVIKSISIQFSLR